MTSRASSTAAESEHGDIRPAYEAEGVDAFYRRTGGTYRNPHEASVVAAIDQVADRLDLSHVLDLACGSGEATLAFRRHGAHRIDGIDPYTADAYAARTRLAAEPFTFADVAAGALDERSYSVVVCSYALHLCEQSRLPGVCLALSRIAPALLVLSPHKRPTIREAWGWHITHAAVVDRVHLTLHDSSGRRAACPTR